MQAFRRECLLVGAAESQVIVGSAICCADGLVLNETVPPTPGLVARTAALGRLVRMSDLNARVKNGRLVLDEATDLPEGTVIPLIPADWWDDLTDEDRRRLEEALVRSEQDLEAGRIVPAEAVFRRLRSKA